MKFLTATAVLCVFCVSSAGHCSEVIQETPARVVVRQHPKTGRPYVSIVSPERADHNPLPAVHKKTSRPDYRLLDPKIKSGQIPYEGPYSDRKKVYILAASLATLGVAGGAVGMAVAPAAATSGASGGAGAFLAGGTAVVAGTAAGTVALTKSGQSDDYNHKSEAKLLDTPGKESTLSNV